MDDDTVARLSGEQLIDQTHHYLRQDTSRALTMIQVLILNMEVMPDDQRMSCLNDLLETVKRMQIHEYYLRIWLKANRTRDD